MPLPLPNLDDRRWVDLVEEGRALIPSLARSEPRWTDHNIHDPGITLMELFAWLTEMDIYRLNRVPERHRRKFLALIGFSPQPPRAARTALSLGLKAGVQRLELPADVEFETPEPTKPDPRFRTLQAVTVVPLTIVAVQVGDGRGLRDRTRDWSEGLPFAVLGENPQPDPEESSPCLYLGFRSLGFHEPLPASVPVTLFLRFEGPGTGDEERERIVQEASEARQACRRPRPAVECAEGLPQDEDCRENEVFPETTGHVPEPVPNEQMPFEEPLPSHHSARTVWEVFAQKGVPPTPTPTPWPSAPEMETGEAGRWVAAGEVEDDTRSLTLDGTVRITFLNDLLPQKSQQGAVPEALYYLRCRLVAGQYDAPPRLLDVAPNSVMAEQAVPVGQWKLTIAAGIEPTGDAPKSGETTRLRLHLDDKGIVTQLSFDPDAEDLPEVTVLRYAEPTPETPGQLVLELDVLGKGDGRPFQQFTLSEAPVQGGSLRLYTLEKKAPEEEREEKEELKGQGEEKKEQEYVWRKWPWREDLDASGRTDRHFMLNPTTGEITFGTGQQGRVPPPGALILAAYRATEASKGNVAAGTIIGLADTPHNRALLPDFEEVRDRLDVTNRAAATDGQEAESLEQATGRAIKTLWAHERLQDLCARSACQTLDQLPRRAVAALRAPQRAVTLLDFERLALDVPGTRIARTRAWANLHPAYPCLKAPGVVTVVVLPYLPTGKPEPSPGLLQTVRRYLHRRRVVTTRVEVIGPTYLEVRVRAEVQALPGASPAGVQKRVIQELDNFLSPLADDPETPGWPFGRDVYRSEVLHVIDGVAGVDHVLSLDLIPGDGEPQCGNVRLCPTWLVTPGTHEIEVVRG